MERLSHNHSDNSQELLSIYIDNAVDGAERRRAETYIQTCPACAQEVQELRMFRELLRDLPILQPRRSFTLDPATVAPPRRLLFPTLRWASLVATVLFLVVLGVDKLGGVSNRDASVALAPASAPSAAQKGQPAGAPQLGGSTAGGGAPETLMQPAASPAGSAAPVGQGSAGPSSPPLPAEVGSTAVAAGAAASEAPGPESSAAVLSAYPPAESLGNGPTTVLTSAPAGGTTADQPPQSSLRTSGTGAAEPVNLDRQVSAQGPWWSSLALGLVEVVLGLIALLFGAAAVWTWRRQI